MTRSGVEFSLLQWKRCYEKAQNGCIVFEV